VPLLLTTLFPLSWKQHTITTPLYRTDENFGSQKLRVEILLCYLLNGATTQLKEKDVIITEKLNIIEKSSMPAQALSQ